MSSNPGEAAEVVVVAIVVIDLKANAEVAVVVKEEVSDKAEVVVTAIIIKGKKMIAMPTTQLQIPWQIKT